MEDFVLNGVSNFGFAEFLSVYLLFRMEQTIKAHTATLEALVKQLTSGGEQHERH